MGFSGEQNKVYKTLLEMGPSSISDLVRKTLIHRPAMYKIIAELMDMELVTITPKGKYKLYVAESPDRLERIFRNVEDDFNAELFHLHESYMSHGKKPIVTYSEGDSAIRALFSDVVHGLKKGDTYYRYSPRLTKKGEKYLPHDYRRIRDKKQLERLIITDQKSLQAMSKRLGKTAKAVPDEFHLFDMGTSQLIYGDKVAVIDYNSKTVIVIEHKIIAEFQRQLFRLLFKKL